MPKTKGNSSIGVNYGKRDMERIGLFAESGWLHGVPYISPHSYEFRDGATKGRQMLSEGGKTKTGLQDCYFERGPYKRIFEKEAYSSAVRENYLASMASSKKQMSNFAFVAGAPSKKHSTPGDFYGTFAGRIKAMSRQEKTHPPHKPEKPNIQTNPGKKGSYGYADITFNKFPEYKSEPYQSHYGMATDQRKHMLHGPLIPTGHPKPCFDMNPWHVETPASTYVHRNESKPGYKGQVWIPPPCPKMQGNNHDGCFGKFPAYKSEKYIDLHRIMQGPREPKVFYPQMQMKSMYTTSITNSNVDFRVNAKNWRNFQPVTYLLKP